MEKDRKAALKEEREQMRRIQKAQEEVRKGTYEAKDTDRLKDRPVIPIVHGSSIPHDKGKQAMHRSNSKVSTGSFNQI